MIYNRSTERVDLLVATNEFDEYGTKRKFTYYGTAQMYITLYSQSQTDDARYKNVTHVGYTDSRDITDNMVIQTAGGKQYKVSLVNDYARRTVVFLEAAEL